MGFSEPKKIAIVDFGASVLLEATQVLASTIIGTQGYMAPEVARGMGQPSSDYYSTGGLLLFVLTSKPPHLLLKNVRCGDWLHC